MITNHIGVNEGLVTIRGNGHTINGADQYRIFHFNGKGGAIENITLTNGLDRALAIYQSHDAGGRLTISNVVVRNTAAGSSNRAIDGGGGKNIVRISNSAIYNNQTDGVVGRSINQITIVNSSIFGNTDDGIYANAQSAEFYLRHVTITGNGGGGVDYDGGNELDVRNSIIYGNTGKDCRLGWSGTKVSVSGSIIGASADESCRTGQSSENPLLASSATGTYYPLLEGSPAINAVSCIVGVDQRGVSRGCPCDIGAIEFDTSDTCPTGGGLSPNGLAWVQRQENCNRRPGYQWRKGRCVAAPLPTSTLIPTERVSSCLSLPAGIEASGVNKWTQCQMVLGHQLGNEELAAAAVKTLDVWGYVPPDLRVCFEAAGGLFKFIDTGAMPRVVSDLSPVGDGGKVCATIDRPGMVVLLLGPPAPMATPAPTATSVPPDSWALSGCRVRTLYALNFRAAPGGDIIGDAPYNVTLTALERTTDWFKVDYHGARGWLANGYLEAIGTCG